MLVKDKDVLSRANFKFLQILEMKQQAIKAILTAIEQGNEQIEFSTSFGGDKALDQLLGRENRQKLLNQK